MKCRPTYLFHILAIFCVFVWGTTFVSTKTLLNNCLSPDSIFFYRFLMAYLAIWFISPKTLFAKNLKDEFRFLLLGITGGSCYFLTENTALKISFVNNVALLVCTAPLITTLLSRLFLKTEKLKKWQIVGSLIAFLGVSFVIFNGRFVLKSNPLGDFLSISAALLWAFYTILLKKLDSKYHIIFITRKVFFYGLMTIIPFFGFNRLQTDLALLTRPVVAENLIFLGMVASLLCFVLWNITLKHLGSIVPTNYIYFNPLITLISSAIVLNEVITPIAAIGAVLILTGLFIVGKYNTT
ncbi:MAG: DMT family transporter [Paludibacter sp.]|nr:DMT family transporter [Paludibacter sp.]